MLWAVVRGHEVIEVEGPEDITEARRRLRETHPSCKIVGVVHVCERGPDGRTKRFHASFDPPLQLRRGDAK